MEELPEINFNASESSTTFVSEINKIKNSIQSAEIKLSLLDLLIRDFFSKKYHVKKNTEYSEMIDFFLQKNKPDLAAFCHEMIKELYSGEDMDQVYHFM